MFLTETTVLNFSSSFFTHRKITTRLGYQSTTTGRKGSFTYVSEKGYCPALLLMNPADPQWIGIPCSAQISKTILCSFKNNQTQQKVLNNFIPSAPAQFCSVGFMLSNKECFSFNWTTVNSITSNDSCFNDLSNFRHIFLAVSAKIFPPIFYSPSVYYQPHRYKSHIKFHKMHIDNSSKAAFCIHRKELNGIGFQGNFFKCQDGTLISSLFVCDGHVDCISDETECNCSSKNLASASKTCQFLLLETGNVGCSPLFDNTKNQCMPYKIEIEKDNAATSVLAEKTKHFQCNSTMTGTTITNDLVDGCLSGDDKLFMSLVGGKGVYFPCPEEHLIPCRHGHPKCFSITKICSYSLNRYGHLDPCPTGDHLQDCKHFFCNTMFKCPNSFCIPWKYLCDGKWDCLKGFDESEHCVQRKQKCPNLFKCKLSDVCLHLIEVCDNVEDCLLGDDEQLCSIKDAGCPANCKCLTFALFCQNTRIFQRNEFARYKFIFLNNSFVSSSLLSESAWSISVTHSEISGICAAIDAKNVKFIHLAHDCITTLSRRCFENLKEVVFIGLDNNCLVFLHAGLFHKLDRLQYLNLSNNKITELFSETFTGLADVKVISLLDIAISKSDGRVFAGIEIKILHVSFDFMCCLMENSSCSISTPWHFLCEDMLSSPILKVVCWFTCTVILLLNVVALILLSKVESKEKEKSRPFRYMAISVNISDIICALPLLFLSIADYTFYDLYFIKQFNWNKSIYCWSVYFLFLYYSLLAPLVLCTLSFSRLQIVKKPLDTKFKDHTFVFKLVMTLFLTIFCLVSLFTLTAVLLDIFNLENIELRLLCSPFFDLSHTLVLAKLLTFVKVFSEVTALLFIITSYSCLFISLKESQEKIKGSTSKTVSNIPLYIQIIPVTF